MARPTETGIEYFPINTNILYSKKVKLVVAEFGPKAWVVLLLLYCKIYREKGYWVDWMDVDDKLLFAQDECKIDLKFIDEVIEGCIRRSLFDKRVFEMFGVLTSDRIQSNYFTATARYKKVEFIEEFLVKNSDVNINRENVCINSINVDIIKKNVCINSQKKKEKEIIDGEGEREGASAPMYAQEEIDLFKKFTDWVEVHTPRVNQLKEKITIEQYLSLKQDIPKEIITNILKAMQNRSDLLKKYVSANLTIRNWAAREIAATKFPISDTPTELTKKQLFERELMNIGNTPQLKSVTK